MSTHPERSTQASEGQTSMAAHTVSRTGGSCRGKGQLLIGCSCLQVDHKDDSACDTSCRVPWPANVPASLLFYYSKPSSCHNRKHRDMMRQIPEAMDKESRPSQPKAGYADSKGFETFRVSPAHSPWALDPQECTPADARRSPVSMAVVGVRKVPAIL